MNTEHIILFYALRVELYTDAAALGISVSAIAEFMLERWWCYAQAAYRVECVSLGVTSAPDCTEARMIVMKD